MQTLSEYITAKNAEVAAWVACGENRWASTLCEDLAHWLSYGITTAAQLEHYLLVSDVFELNRSAYGFKPSWGGLMAQSNEELRAQLPALEKACREEMERVAEWEWMDAEAEAREEREHNEAVARATTREEWTLQNAFSAAGLA